MSNRTLQYGLHYGSAKHPVAEVVPDKTYSGMWRVRTPDGWLSRIWLIRPDAIVSTGDLARAAFPRARGVITHNHRRSVRRAALAVTTPSSSNTGRSFACIRDLMVFPEDGGYATLGWRLTMQGREVIIIRQHYDIHAGSRFTNLNGVASSSCRR